MSAPAIEVTDTPQEADLTFIGKSLSDFNEADVGPSGRRPLAVYLRDQSGSIVAGLSGYTAWGWLYVQWLFVSEDQRGRGCAGALLGAAEVEALARQCHGAYIDTFNPEALKAYQRAGYAIFGQLPDFPKGRTRSFLSKSLALSGSAV